jgi:crotonobetainyl-CoA:carnitine CoA-transferase CaiB-like acyl-CoA transferase
VPVTVVHAGGATTRTFNQRKPTLGGRWILHRRYTFNAGTGAAPRAPGERPPCVIDSFHVNIALADLLVVDFTTVRSGPTCTKILADFGAEVIRVERPGETDQGRVFFDQADLHRNKQSVVVNLQDARGVAIVRRLAARADVVVENYRPDVKRRLGIDYDSLSRDNPRLVYASISGFGQRGPYRDRPGYDQIIQGMSGLMWLTGSEASAPLRTGIPIADLLAGYFCALGIVVALVERGRSGRGQVVSTSLLEALVGSLSFQAANHLNTGAVPPPVGNHHPQTAPMGVYRARDGFMNLAVGNDEMFRRLGQALGVEALADDPRFARNLARVKHREALDAVIIERLAARPVAEWVETLNAAGVACGPILRLDEVFGDPQVREAGLVHEQVHDSFGPVKVVGLPVHLSRTPATVRTPAPVPGAQTRRVLERFGFGPEEIAGLAAAGVIELTTKEGPGEPAEGAPRIKEGPGEPSQGAPRIKEGPGEPSQGAPRIKEGPGEPSQGAPTLDE